MATSPRIMLMDEPLSNIDPPNRLRMREENKSFHKQHRLTTLYVTHNLADGVALADRIAPEHLQICTADAERLATRVRHAGAIFIGALTPEAIGDYVGGPNHVLPTARSARFSSGLSVLDFMKRTTISRMTPAALAHIGPAAERLASSEGLEAHGLSIRARLDRLNEG